MSLNETTQYLSQEYKSTLNQNIIKVPSKEDCMIFNFILDSVITGSLCLIGFGGNILSFSVLWQEKGHVSIMFLLQSLVIADSTVIWMIFIQDVIPGLAYIIPILQDCHHVCANIVNITRPLLWMSMACVLWFTVAAAFNRFIITCKPTHAPLICTLEFARKQIIFIVIIAIIIGIPLTFDRTLEFELQLPSTSLYSTRKLYDISLYQYVYLNGVVLFVFLLLPLSSSIVICANLVRTLNSIKRLRRALASLYKAQNTEMSQVILTLCITLLVCYIPTCIRCIIQWSFSVFNEQCGYLNFYLDSFCKLFLALNSSMKLLIFSLFGHNFWCTLKQILGLRSKPSNIKASEGLLYKCGDMSDMTLISQADS